MISRLAHNIIFIDGLYTRIAIGCLEAGKPRSKYRMMWRYTPRHSICFKKDIRPPILRQQT